ncbi:MAG: restriction endonuclease subunit S [Methylomonas sp.]|nr:restriction endonuclease subunit S [Methylomonas sp.]
MSQFELSPHVDKNKIFIVRQSELEGRLDVDFYRPKLMELEKQIRAQSTKRLSDFIIRMASGATPSVTDEEKFYSDAKSGIPFLRVQNLSTSGQLNLDGVRYINKETHEGYLKRSQVSRSDLLVKITGVGRMAIASVAPKGFVGNTNQHMVVIKTIDAEQSEYLANYLNLDIVEALASRRSTGGTRPALDYPALRSIPVIEGIDFSILKQAEKIRQQKKQQAQELLAGIDDYLLSELGIILPAQDNNLKNRIFKIQFKTVSDQRIDPIFYSALSSGLFSSKYDYYKLGEVAHYFKSGFGVGRQDQVEEEHGVIQIRPTNISSLGELIFTKNVYVSPESLAENDFLNYGDVLFNNTNSQELVGKTSYFYISDKELTYSNHITVIKVNNEKLNAIYLQNVLNLYQRKKYFYSICTNWNNQSGVGNELLRSIKIPLPPLNKQEKIVEHIQTIRNKAQQLQTEAAQILADAKAEVERMILGDSGGEPCQPAG